MLIKKSQTFIVVFEYLTDIELPPNIKWGSSPDIFEYNKTAIFLQVYVTHFKY